MLRLLRAAPLLLLAACAVDEHGNPVMASTAPTPAAAAREAALTQAETAPLPGAPVPGAATPGMTTSAPLETGMVVVTPLATGRMTEKGTCFAFVTKEPDGTFTVNAGIGDGSAAPAGNRKTGLSAAEADAQVTKERAWMDVSPECLAINVSGSTAARPALKPAKERVAAQ